MNQYTTHYSGRMKVSHQWTCKITQIRVICALLFKDDKISNTYLDLKSQKSLVKFMFHFDVKAIHVYFTIHAFMVREHNNRHV